MPGTERLLVFNLQPLGQSAARVVHHVTLAVLLLVVTDNGDRTRHSPLEKLRGKLKKEELLR